LNFRPGIAFAATLAVASMALPGAAFAQSATAETTAKPVGLPEMTIGSATAPVTIIEYASMSCSHCAAFGQNVFPMLRSKYIDTGKVRFVFREFPLDIKAAAASILARCIGKGDPDKFFNAVELMFKLQDQLMAQTKQTLIYVGKQHGMSEDEVKTCEEDQAQFEKLNADQQFAARQVKIAATPTFFINGARFQGAMSYEELEARIEPMLRK
jgi:protein-disulfide isomerase